MGLQHELLKRRLLGEAYIPSPYYQHHTHLPKPTVGQDYDTYAKEYMKWQKNVEQERAKASTPSAVKEWHAAMQHSELVTREEDAAHIATDETTKGLYKFDAEGVGSFAVFGSRHHGGAGIAFEAAFKATAIANRLTVRENTEAKGPMWDVKFGSANWNGRIAQARTNLKNARTRWVCHTSASGLFLPWETDVTQSGMTVKDIEWEIHSWLKGLIRDLVLLKPVDDETEHDIVRYVRIKEYRLALRLFTEQAWKYFRLAEFPHHVQLKFDKQNPKIFRGFNIVLGHAPAHEAFDFDAFNQGNFGLTHKGNVLGTLDWSQFPKSTKQEGKVLLTTKTLSSGDMGILTGTSDIYKQVISLLDTSVMGVRKPIFTGGTALSNKAFLRELKRTKRG